MKESMIVITSRDMTTDNGEWRLLTNRARVLQETYGIDSHIYAMNPHKRVVATKIQSDNLTFIPYKSPWDFIIRARMLITQLRHANPVPSGYLLSGLQTYLLSPFLARQSTLVDIHGTLEEWLEYPPRRLGSLAPWAFRLAQVLEWAAIKSASAVLVVSRSLGDYVKRRYGATKCLTVPCGNQDSPECNESSTWRRRLDLGDDDIVLVFNGGISRWQMVPETIELFRMIRDSWPKAKLLILTAATEAANNMANQAGLTRSEFRTHHAQSGEVVEILRECDVALMLRESNRTNAVAFPNKFADYVSACLPIITSPGLGEIAELIRSFDVGILVEPEQQISPAALAALDVMLMDRRSRGQILQRFEELWESHLDMTRLVAPLGEWVKHEASLHQ